MKLLTASVVLFLTACSFGPIRVQPYVNGATVAMTFTQKPHSTTNAAPATKMPSLLEKEMRVIALEIRAVKMLKEQGPDMNFNVK